MDEDEDENFPYYDACLDCKHLLGSIVDPASPPNEEAYIISFCAAFPKGIPEVIQSGENWHRTNIKGDLGIKYERGINPVSNSDLFPESEGAMAETIPADVVGQLREAVAALKGTPIFTEIVEPQDAVLARFQPVFSPERLAEITPEEFRSFLLLENNHHWSGLHRQGPRMCADMGKLREALKILVDETKAVENRLDKSIEMISGMGKNVASAILLVTQPDQYGVWNNRSEAVMKRLGIWPQFDKGESFGRRYAKVNQLLLQLRDALQIDLWTLDALWWYLDKEPPAGPTVPIDGGMPPESAQRFGLERHLHEFLRDNWDHIELGKDWELYQEPGDDEAGYEYPCEVGRIDLLAKHRKKPHWLVIELKRNLTSDQTVGQLLRYVGWVKGHLAASGEEVHGMIICREADSALHYAISAVPNVRLRLYQVEFRLKVPETTLGTTGLAVE